MNLISKPWIPVRRADGSRDKIAPWQITDHLGTDKSPIVAIASPRPDWGRPNSRVTRGHLGPRKELNILQIAVRGTLSDASGIEVPSSISRCRTTEAGKPLLLAKPFLPHGSASRVTNNPKNRVGYTRVTTKRSPIR
jgi:CRISPR-associated protein Cse1 (CRISPR_cse1)